MGSFGGRSALRTARAEPFEEKIDEGPDPRGQMLVAQVDRVQIERGRVQIRQDAQQAPMAQIFLDDEGRLENDPAAGYGQTPQQIAISRMDCGPHPYGEFPTVLLRERPFIPRPEILVTEDFVVREVGGPPRRAVSLQILRRGAQDHVDRCNSSGDEPALQSRGDAQGDVKSFVGQVHDPVREVNIQLQLRVPSAKQRQFVGEAQHAE